MRDWTPLPLPTEDQVEAAAGDLLQIAELRPLQRGGVTFARDGLGLRGWWDTTDERAWDWDGELDEIAVPLADLFISDDSAEDPDFRRGQNLARCRLAIRHAVDRRDQSIVLMNDALEGRGR